MRHSMFIGLEGEASWGEMGEALEAGGEEVEESP